MQWRRALFTLHRDTGFFVAGLTVIYAVSGVAVNHRQDWDYNQSTTKESSRVGTPSELLKESVAVDRRTELAQNPSSVTPEEEQLLIGRIAESLSRKGPPRSKLWRNPTVLVLHFEPGERDSVHYDLSTGVAEHIQKKNRFLLRQFNFLHLNEPGQLWTYVADAFAVALLFLALSGVIMTKGKHGIVGRGGVFMAVGVIVPVLAWVLLRQ